MAASFVSIKLQKLVGEPWIHGLTGAEDEDRNERTLRTIQ